MHPDLLPLDADAFRARLMSHLAMDRIRALHALEVEAEVGADPTRVATVGAAQRFAARGIPFFATDDPHYLAWVDKAVSLWQRLQDTLPFAVPFTAATTETPVRHA